MEETIDYKGYDIEIIRDEDVRNPWDDSDGEPPIAVYSDRSIQAYGTRYGDVSNPPELTKEQIKANLTEIINLVDVKNIWELTEDRRNYGDAVDAINNKIDSHLDYVNPSDRLDLLCDLYNMIGIPALCAYAEVLVVLTPEFFEGTGAPREHDDKNLTNAVDLFSAWAWGDVYGFVVKGPEDENIDVDSCWGFYGSDHEKSGLLEESKSAINCEIKCREEAEVEARRTRYNQIKKWIKGRVPLIYRHAE